MGKALIVMAFILSACATVPKTPISPRMFLRSRYIGKGSGNELGPFTDPMTARIMEVFNDSIPLKGKLTILFMEGSDTRFFRFDNGTIDSEGELVLPLKEDTKAVLSFHKGENKMRLDGLYYYVNNIGRLTLDKK